MEADGATDSWFCRRARAVPTSQPDAEYQLMPNSDIDPVLTDMFRGRPSVSMTGWYSHCVSVCAPPSLAGRMTAEGRPFELSMSDRDRDCQ